MCSLTLNRSSAVRVPRLTLRLFAAIVQPGADAKLPPLFFGFEAEVGQRPFRRGIGLFCQHQRELRDTGAMPAGVGALGVDCACQDLDHRVDQCGLRVDQVVVFQRYGRLGGQCFDEPEVLPAEPDEVAATGFCRVHELQNTEHLAAMRNQRHAEHRNRTVARFHIKASGAREIEARLAVDVIDDHGFLAQGDVGRHVPLVGRATVVMQGQLERGQRSAIDRRVKRRLS